MTYALGRGVDYGDMPTVRRVLHETSGDDYRLRSLIEAIAMSDVFRMNVTTGAAPAEGLDSQQKIASTGSMTPRAGADPGR